MIWKIHKTEVVLPSLKDPRVFMVGVLTLYTIIGQTILTFDQQRPHILVSICVACVLDILINYRRTRQLILPVSGAITGIGLGLLIESIQLWPYILAPILAIGSKGIIRFQERNIFNPSNFGLTVLLLLTPSTVTVVVTQWTGSLLVVMLVVIIGGFTAYRVSRWDLVLSFVAGFCVMAFIQDAITHKGPAFVYGPMIGTAFQVFALSMLTDPKTTPETRKMRILFGLAIAFFDGLLRLVDNQYSLFIALFFVSAWVPILRLLASVIKSRLASSITPQEETTERNEVESAALEGKGSVFADIEMKKTRS